MAKKKSNLANNKSSAQPPPKANLTDGQLKLSTHILIALGIAIITLLFLQVCLDNQLGTWDDTPYIKENPLVKDLSWQGLKYIFSKPSMGNYHPLTILSFAIEYSLVQFEPWLYHFDNLLLHVIGTVLVYWFIFLLTGRPVIAIVTSLLFGLHPMHMESVAWVAARKDVLYGVFYLAACIFYLKYTRATERRNIWYAALLIAFVLSLLSKPVAVTLPVVLVLIDIFEKRVFNKKLWAEKLPLFALALIFGVVAVLSQHSAGAMDVHKVSYNPRERLALGCYALITYLWKAVIPASLHCLYLYPDKVNGTIPWTYFLYPIAAAALIFLAWKYGRKNKFLVFGLLFFLINIFLVLQFLPVGDAIVAERYSYIPYIGLFFVIGRYVSGFFDGTFSAKYKYIVSGAAIIYIGFMGVLANERCKVWDDDVSLWRDEIEKEPNRGPAAFNNLGYIYYGKWSKTPPSPEKQLYFDSAYYLMKRAITIDPKFPNGYLAMGELLRSSGKFDEAKRNYDRAIQMDPKGANFYIGLAVLYYVMHSMDSAGYYFRKVIAIQPTGDAYGNYANLLTEEGKDDSALINFNTAISLSKNNYILYMNRGKLLKKMNRLKEAEPDLNVAITMDPDIGEPYYLRSFCDTQNKNYPQAIKDVERSAALGYRYVDTAYYNLLKRSQSR